MLFMTECVANVSIYLIVKVNLGSQVFQKQVTIGDQKTIN